MSQVVNAILDLLRESDKPLSGLEIAEILSRTKYSVYKALRILLENKEIIKIGSSRNVKYGLESKISIYKIGTTVTDFKKIETTNELIGYLSNMSARLNNTSVLCQYTNLRAVVSIISEKSWYLGSPKNMNDGLELKQGLDKRDNIFFSSFMAEQKESIAMWSMYAQPWEDGVMIAIPVQEFKKWIKDIKKVYSADINTKKPDRNTFVQLNKATVSVTRVAYSNKNGDILELSCGSTKNSLFKSINDPSLIGYIKDDAWSYEKELRLRIDLGKSVNYKGVAIDIPEYVIDSMIITKGPRFKGDPLERLETEINRKIKTDSSLFYGKLQNTPCDGCAYKK